MTGHTHSIKPHHKVRSGCFQCKTRRIKCDEQKPRCSQCVRYSQDCIYPSRNPDSSSPSSSRSSRSATATTEIRAGPGSDPISVPKDLNNSTTELNLGDLELMQNWTLKASSGFSFSKKPSDLEFWRVELPAQALKYPFLMRGILAVSALSLGRQRPDAKPHFLAVAAYHENLALPSYRYLVSDLENRMDRENCTAIMAFGNLVTAYAFACPSPPGSVLFTRLCSSTGVPEWLRILRGGKEIRQMVRKWGAENLIARDLPENIDLSLCPYDSQITSVQDRITDLSSSVAGDDQDITAYQEALDILRQCIAVPYQPELQLNFICALHIWAERAPIRFLELLDKLKPPALVVLGCLCVLLKRAEGSWFVAGAAERILTELCNIFEPEWRPWIDWPMEEVFGG